MFRTLKALFSRLFRAGRPRPRPAVRLNVEFLDERAVPADIAMLGARLDSPTVVGFDFAATDVTGDFQVAVYRSADLALAAADVFVAGATVTPPATGTGTGAVNLGAEMPLDPARNFVLVVADPGDVVSETDEANNTASFRKLTLGVVTHGFTLTGTPPAWLVPMVTALQAQGYEAAIPFAWTPLSQLPIRGGTIIAGNAMAVQVRAAATALATQPNDVVDLHLIGHSRGTAVISQAFRSLEQRPGPEALQLGFFQGTFLDPHVARNNGSLFAGLVELSARTGTSTVGDFSYDPNRLSARLFAAGTLAFQAAANDPPAFVSANVDRAEMYYQRIAWDQTLPGSVERVIGVNFLSPLPSAVPNFSANPIVATDLGPLGIGHYEVPIWYLNNVVL
jgi:hypothetical protein